MSPGQAKSRRQFRRLRPNVFDVRTKLLVVKVIDAEAGQCPSVRLSSWALLRRLCEGRQGDTVDLLNERVRTDNCELSKKEKHSIVWNQKSESSAEKISRVLSKTPGGPIAPSCLIKVGSNSLTALPNANLSYFNADWNSQVIVLH